jgi:hypothetical protein
LTPGSTTTLSGALFAPHVCISRTHSVSTAPSSSGGLFPQLRMLI